MAGVALMLRIIFCGSGGRRAISCLLQIRKVSRRSELNCSWEEAQIQFSGRRELEISHQVGYRTALQESDREPQPAFLNINYILGGRLARLVRSPRSNIRKAPVLFADPAS
jgi:hypothetical protein